MTVMIALGLAVAVLAIVGGQALEGGHVSSLVQPSAFLIVIGGTLGAVLVQSSPRVFKNALELFFNLNRPLNMQISADAESFIAYGEAARKRGKLFLEDEALRQTDPFMRKCLQLVADDQSTDFARSCLEQEARAQLNELRRSIKVWESAGGYAPTIGILGSVIGLLNVMESLKDPTGLVSGLGVAFVATIYGLASANLLFLPLANKFKHLAEDYTRLYEMRIEGAMALIEGDATLQIRDRLAGYLPTGSLHG